jgi:hypothetical protein
MLLQRSFSALCYRGVSTLILWTQLPSLLYARCSVFAVHCVTESQHSDPLAQLPMFLQASCSAPLCTAGCRGQHLILWHSCPCCCALQRSFAVTVLQRSQHSDPSSNSCPCLRLQRSWCTVLQRSQHLILWHSCPCCCTLVAAFLCSALCCRGVSTLILWQLPMFVLRSCSVPCSGTVLQRSQHSDWHSCPCCLLCFLQRSFAVHCVAEESAL